MTVRAPPLRAPGADVPPATHGRGAGSAPSECRATPAPDHDRSRVRHQKAPGHGRPRAASSGAVRHDRPRATPRAPGADVPPATTVGAPGQHRPSAMAIATVPSPAGPRRLRQEVLPRVPTNPRTLTYSRTPTKTTADSPALHISEAHFHPPAQRGILRGARSRPPRRPHACERGNPAPGPLPAAARTPLPWLSKGPGVRSKPLLSQHTTHQVHPAIQVPAPPAVLLRRGIRASSTSTPPAPHPRPPAEDLPAPAHSPLATWWRGAGWWGTAAPHLAVSVRLWPASKGAARPVPLPRGGTIGGPGPIHCVPTTPPLQMVERGPGGAAHTHPVDGAQVRW